MPEDVRAFCGYVNGIASADGLVQEIEKEVQSLKYIEEEEASYMTYAMKLEEEREDGIRQGIRQGIEHAAVEMLRDKMDTASIMKYTKLSAERIADLAKSMHD